MDRIKFSLMCAHTDISAPRQPVGLAIKQDCLKLEVHQPISQSVLNHCRVIMYADDVVFYIPNDNINNAASLLQHDASNVYNWFTKSGLCINTDKTKVVVFNPDKQCDIDAVKIKMGSSTLETCTQYEYLGVILDGNINLVKSVTKTVCSSNYRSVMLRKTRVKMSTKTATQDNIGTLGHDWAIYVEKMGQYWHFDIGPLLV